MLSTALQDIGDARTGAIDPDRLCGTLRISLSQLARIVRLHRNTLSTHPHAPKAQERLGELARILVEASELAGPGGGDVGRAVLWFRYQPLPGFDGKTAEDLVSEGYAGAVRAYLQDLRHGVYA